MNSIQTNETSLIKPLLVDEIQYVTSGEERGETAVFAG